MDKKTRQKEAILSALLNTSLHPTADWIYHEVRKQIPNISLGTVYRNLRQLKQKGDVQELTLSSSLSRYDAQKENHYHFRCDNCGNIFNLDVSVINDLDRRVAAQTGFNVSGHRLEFNGLCHDCQVA